MAVVVPRRLLHPFIACTAVLSALGACSPAQPEPTPDSTANAPVEAPHAAQAMQTANAAPTVSDELPANPWPAPTAGHNTSAVAAGNGIYLVTWVEWVDNGLPDVLGVRVRASDGARLDSSPIRIGTGSSVQYQPAVAFDGSNFLVVWEDIRSAPAIYGARVRASDGVVLDPAGLYLSRTPMSEFNLPQQNPAVAFDGTNYLVTWEGLYYEGSTIQSGAQAIRVRASDGSCVEEKSTLLIRGGRNTRVAYTNGTYLVTWARGVGIEATRISASTGQPVSSLPISLGLMNTDLNASTVAAGNGEFLTTWIGKDNILWARRVRASDGVKLDAADIAVGPAAVVAPAATFDGADYRINWQATRDGARKVLTSKVSIQGVVAADAELVLAELASSESAVRGGIAATAEGRYLASYTRYDGASRNYRVQFRLVNDVHAPAPCATGTPTLVLNSASPLTLECGSGPYKDPGAQAFDGCGNPIQVHAYNTGADASGPGPNTSAEGSYAVTYAAWDALGNTVSALRTVNVDDSAAPALALKGGAHLTHTCGSQWVDPGVTATDACYGDLSAQVWHTGDVNGWAAGTYTVTYSLTDSGGNSATSVTRTVDVVNCPW
ncbi:DUF5011 domain-containing protein [Hyalangium versicolor]|uniref:DUF5011 domain-containing protein n=1 Tax=Hyalangium versicolor TaxID=2861190 RepID=UPI001CCE9F78|nr:DUF5011 domain-containing protein [Hyalangium versicolor]